MARLLRGRYSKRGVSRDPERNQGEARETGASTNPDSLGLERSASSPEGRVDPDDHGAGSRPAPGSLRRPSSLRPARLGLLLVSNGVRQRDPGLRRRTDGAAHRHYLVLGKSPDARYMDGRMVSCLRRQSLSGQQLPLLPVSPRGE